MSRRTASADLGHVIDDRQADRQPADAAVRQRPEPRLRTLNRPRQIAYWGATGLVTIVPLLAAFAYLTSSPQAVENFRHVGYPQQLRVLLGIAKLAGAIVLLVPRLPKLKEWAYAGFTFMWIAATVAHYVAGDKPLFLVPIALIGLLAVSYRTRAANRRVSADAILS
jgi:hypothetical protein